jgi:hypothetical protein
MQQPTLDDALVAFQLSDPDVESRSVRYVARALWRIHAGETDRRFFGGALASALGLAERTSVRNVVLSDGSTVADAVVGITPHARWLSTLVLGAAQYMRDPNAVSCADAAARTRATIGIHEATLGPIASCADCDQAEAVKYDAVQPGEVRDLRTLATRDLSSVEHLKRWHVWPYQRGPAYVKRPVKELIDEFVASLATA